MVTKPGTASTEPSNAFRVAEAARLRVYKYLSITELSRQGPSGRVFSNKKKETDKAEHKVAREIYLKQDHQLWLLTDLSLYISSCSNKEGFMQGEISLAQQKMVSDQ